MKIGPRVLGGAVILIGTMCSCAGPTYSDWPVRPETPSLEALYGPIEPVSMEPIDPPEPPPPWVARMPALSPDPAFPLLPGDNREASRSVGTVSDGWLFRGRAPRMPHPHLAFLSVQHQRGLFFGTDRLVRILEATASAVADRHDGAVTYLGNLSGRGGGDIPYSFSHNSGRDADIAFFLESPAGRRLVPQDLVSLDERGIHEADGVVYHWDDEANWSWFRALMTHGGDDLQYVFLSKPLQRRLLAEGERRGASEQTLERARRILRQPAGAPPHADHYHVRLYCSPTSMASGCRESGAVRPWHRPAVEARREVLQRIRDAADHAAPGVRRHAVERAALLDDGTANRLAGRLIDDQAETVRAAAARVMGGLNADPGRLAKPLESERSPNVYVEIVDALARVEEPGATQVLVDAFRDRRSFDSHRVPHSEARVFVAEALSRREDARAVPVLLEGLESRVGSVRRASAQALRYVANHAVAPRSLWARGSAARRAVAVARWRAWDQSGGDSRREWLLRGFQREGYDVSDLSVASVWPLCRAILGDEHISWNAQKILMDISGTQPRSLRWPKEAANIFWRRWFEKRRARYGAPPVPPGMSTLDETD